MNCLSNLSSHNNPSISYGTSRDKVKKDSDGCYVIGSARYLIFTIMQGLLTLFRDPESTISDVEEALMDCSQCQPTLTLPCPCSQCMIPYSQCTGLKIVKDLRPQLLEACYMEGDSECCALRRVRHFVEHSCLSAANGRQLTAETTV